MDRGRGDRRCKVQKGQYDRGSSRQAKIAGQSYARPHRRGDRARLGELNTLLGGGTVAGSVAAHAEQTERVRRIGVLTFSAESDQEGQSSVAAFREGLRKLGWMEGRNSEIDIRWAAADVELMKRF